jgi:hypothetical protein
MFQHYKECEEMHFDDAGFIGNVLVLCWMFTKILGMMVEVNFSTKEKLERKKYMDVCRWVSEIMAMMISRLPNIVTWYMGRNSAKKTGCNLGSSKFQEVEVLKSLY